MKKIRCYNLIYNRKLINLSVGKQMQIQTFKCSLSSISQVHKGCFLGSVKACYFWSENSTSVQVWQSQEYALLDSKIPFIIRPVIMVLLKHLSLTVSTMLNFLSKRCRLDMKEQTPLMTLSGPWWVWHVCMRTSSGALTLRWWSFGKLIICAYCAYWAQSLSLVQHFATIWTVAHQALLSMGFPRQEYWIGLPFPSPGDLPDPGIKPESSVFPAFQPDSLPSESSGKTQLAVWSGNNISLDLSSQKPSFQGVLILNVVQTCSILHINTQSHIKSSSTIFPWQAFSQPASLNFPGFPLNLCTLCKPCTPYL